MADSERANSQPEHDGQLQETRSSAELSDNWWAALYQAALGEGDPRVRRQRIDEAQKGEKAAASNEHAGSGTL